METVTLTKISRFTTGKDGTALKTKTGKPYTRVIIQTEEHEKSLSGFGSKVTDAWTEGSKAEVEITKNGEYLNFSLPKKEAVQTEDMKAIKEDIERILLRLGRMMNGIDLLLQRGAPKKNTAPDARDAAREAERTQMERTPGDNVTSFDEPFGGFDDDVSEQPF